MWVDPTPLMCLMILKKYVLRTSSRQWQIAFGKILRSHTVGRTHIVVAKSDVLAKQMSSSFIQKHYYRKCIKYYITYNKFMIYS